MARPSTAHERRRQFLPILAHTFAETGYRRATTAELARRCEVPENTLYRLWRDKKQMYLEAIDYIYTHTVETWSEQLDPENRSQSGAEQLLAYEGSHYGEHGFYRIIFSGLSEIDDAEIRKALRAMYRRFHRFILGQIAAHREMHPAPAAASSELVAWAVVGLGTVSGIGRELGLISRQQQRDLFGQVGKSVLGVRS